VSETNRSRTVRVGKLTFDQAVHDLVQFLFRVHKAIPHKSHVSAARYGFGVRKCLPLAGGFGVQELATDDLHVELARSADFSGHLSQVRVMGECTKNLNEHRSTYRHIGEHFSQLCLQ
jgi:hypothetical protein